MTLIEERERESLTVKSDDMTVCGVSIFGCCFLYRASKIKSKSTPSLNCSDRYLRLLYQSRRSCVVYASSVSRGHAMSIGVAMARVQLAVIAQHWSASGPMELFVVVVKDSITMVGWCGSFV